MFCFSVLSGFWFITTWAWVCIGSESYTTSVCFCLNSRVGVCGICSPGQHLVSFIVGDLLVPVLSSLLLLLRPLLLLSWHLLLSTTLSVTTNTSPVHSTDLTAVYSHGSFVVFFLLLSVWGREDGEERTTCSASCVSLLHSWCTCCCFPCPLITGGPKNHTYPIRGE